ncbi:MAG: polyprenyl synthetase family protein [Phycisphaerae bacterium]|jgi:geranylgeranyl diphosphate synthase type II
MQKVDIKKALAQKAEVVNGRIKTLLGQWSGIPERLADAIGYVLAAPGKRVRAAVVLWCCELIWGSENDDALNAAAAIEMVHTYSLVHDDLPAMDDDDFRRGSPSCHKAFDEATAILTGDSLLTMAFEVIAANISNADRANEMIKILARAAGPCGMIAGQMADIIAEKLKPDEKTLEYIHINKTAKMFQASACLGAIAGGADEKKKQLLSQFGLNLGLAFQISDDILDVVSDSKTLGKTAGKDAKQGKLTYPAVLGLDESKKNAREIAHKAAKILEPFGEKAIILKELALTLVDRKK